MYFIYNLITRFKRNRVKIIDIIVYRVGPVAATHELKLSNSTLK